jgi:pyridoxamine 5'-phosphate oxidase
MDIASLRKSYERAELDETASAPQPLQQFQLWLQQALAAELPEPNAMTLATVGTTGRPSTRIVLIKGLDERGIVWYTNYGSRKGRELAAQPYAALQFHWVELERVVRIEGRVERRVPRSRTRTTPAAHSIHGSVLGVAAKRSDRSRATLVAAAAQGCRPICTDTAAAAALGRATAAARPLEFLARPQKPAPRPAALPPGRRRQLDPERLAP